MPALYAWKLERHRSLVPGPFSILYQIVILFYCKLNWGLRGQPATVVIETTKISQSPLEIDEELKNAIQEVEKIKVESILVDLKNLGRHFSSLS